jgi:hypothetical protein
MNNDKNNQYTCGFCNKSFASSFNLKNHQKTTKYCLAIQNKPIEESYLCNFCNKGFTVKAHYNTHILTCKDKKALEEKEEIDKLRDRIKELENYINEKDKKLIKDDKLIGELTIKLSSKDELNKKLKEEIKELRKTNSELIKRPTTNTSIINNNNDNRQQNQYNIQFNELFEKLDVLNEQNIKERIKKLNSKEFLENYNYGNFYPEFFNNLFSLLNNLSFCTDISRKTLVTKDENLKPIKIPAEEMLSKCFNYGNGIMKEHLANAEQIVDYKIESDDKTFTSPMLDNFNESIKDIKDSIIDQHKINYFDNSCESSIRLTKQLPAFIKTNNNLKTNKNVPQLES